MADQPPQSTSLWARIRGFVARLFRRAPPEPGRFESGSKFAWRGWVGVAPWMWPSRDYLIYVRTGLSDWKKHSDAKVKFKEGELALDLTLPAGDFVAEWLDTKTTSTIARVPFTHAGGTRPFAVPAFEEDIALTVRRK